MQYCYCGGGSGKLYKNPSMYRFVTFKIQITSLLLDIFANKMLGIEIASHTGIGAGDKNTFVYLHLAFFAWGRLIHNDNLSLGNQVSDVNNF